MLIYARMAHGVVVDIIADSTLAQPNLRDL